MSLYLADAQYQLSQIKLGLAKDPNNVEMQTLKAELEDLIALTKEYLSSQAPAPAPAAAAASTSASSASASTSASTTPRTGSGSAAASSKAKPAAASGVKVSYKPGDECSCRYSDGKWYPARITQISGSTDQPVYTVVFKGYDTPEVVTMNDIRPSNKWDSGAAGAGAGGSGTGGGAAGGEKRKAGEPTKEDLEKERKKKKNEKKAETLKAKAEEQAAKQKGWQAFAKKGTKKGIHIPGVKGQFPVSISFPERERVAVHVLGPANLCALTLQARAFSGHPQKATRTHEVRKLLPALWARILHVC